VCWAFWMWHIVAMRGLREVDVVGGGMVDGGR